MRKKNSQQKDKLSNEDWYVLGKKKTQEKGEKGRGRKRQTGKGEKNQRARLQINFDCSTRSVCWQGSEMIWFTRIEREQAERHARQNKFNHLFHQEENLSLSSTKDPPPPPGLNQLQTNLILQRDTGGINSSFQFNSAPRPGRGKLSSITFMCLTRQP